MYITLCEWQKFLWAFFFWAKMTWRVWVCRKKATGTKANRKLSHRKKGRPEKWPTGNNPEKKKNGKIPPKRKKYPHKQPDNKKLSENNSAHLAFRKLPPVDRKEFPQNVINWKIIPYQCDKKLLMYLDWQKNTVFSE